MSPTSATIEEREPPTSSTRGKSKKDLRRRYDGECAGAVGSGRACEGMDERACTAAFRGLVRAEP